MIRQGYQLGCSYEFWRGPEHVSFWLFKFDDLGKRLAADSITWVETREGMERANPTFDLPMERAQRLMDMLWEAGLRPVAGKQSEGVVSAQSRHLEDMRALAFTKLGVEKPVA